MQLRYGVGKAVTQVSCEHFSTMETEALHIRTPVLESHQLTKLSGFRVFLKLENVQPVSSFKIRGVGNLCQKVRRQQGYKNIAALGLCDAL